METEGKLELVSLYRLLRIISARRETGILTVQAQHDMLAVTFLEGRIVAADAMNQTMEEGLAEVLESQGLVSSDRLAEAVAEQQSSGERLAVLLLKERVVGREQLLQAIRLQTYRLLLQLLRWREGEYNLFVGEEISYEDGIAPISVEELLVRSVGDLAAEGPLSGPLPHVESIFERSPDRRQLRVIGREGDGDSEEAGKAWVTPTELAVLEGLDGESPASTLLGRQPIDDYSLRFALHQLLEAKLIRTAPIKTPEVFIPTSGLTPPSSLLRTQVEEPRGDELGELRVESPPSPPPQVAPKPVPLKPRPRQRHETLGGVVRFWLCRVLALVLAGLLLSLVPSRATRSLLFFPYPGQAAQRGEFESGQRAALYYKIDRASRTYYLLYGRFPEELGLLADLQLVAPKDLYDPQGRLLSYGATDLAYTLQPLKDGVPVPGLERTAELTGDFLLSPQFSDVSRVRSTRPLILLD